MKKVAIFYPSTDSEVPVYYSHLVQILSVLAAKYGITAEILALLQTHATKVTDTYKQAKADAEKAQSSTERKKVAFVAAREDLMRELQRITHLPNFEEADAELMGIRRLKGKADPNTAVPSINDITVLPDQIIIDWTKSSFQGVLVEGSYDAHTWSEIARDFRSPYEDTRPNRIARQPEPRYYRFRYLLNDKAVGLYSSVIKVLSEID